MNYFIAMDGSVIPTPPEDFYPLSDEENGKLYNTNWGNHFSEHGTN